MIRNSVEHLNHGYSELFEFQKDSNVERINSASILLRMAYVAYKLEMEEYNLLKLCHTGK